MEKENLVGQGVKKHVYMCKHAHMHIFQVSQGAMVFLNLKFQIVVA